MSNTIIALTGITVERHSIAGYSAKQAARMIAELTGQNAIWTGKVMGEWHVTDKRTNKVSAIVYERAA